MAHESEVAFGYWLGEVRHTEQRVNYEALFEWTYDITIVDATAQFLGELDW